MERNLPFAFVGFLFAFLGAVNYAIYPTKAERIRARELFVQLAYEGKHPAQGRGKPFVWNNSPPPGGQDDPVYHEELRKLGAIRKETGIGLFLLVAVLVGGGLAFWLSALNPQSGAVPLLVLWAFPGLGLPFAKLMGGLD